MSYYGYENLIKSSHNLISFYSFSTQKTSIFSAFVTDFNDSFKSNWTSTEIYGKMDAVATFKNTTRSITIAFDIPSSDKVSSLNNMVGLDDIIKGLYPIYNESGKQGIATITAPPLFRIKFANYIVNVATGEGLLGYLNGFDFKPDMTAGHFIDNGRLFPKLIKVSFTFNILHEHPLGSKMQGSKPIPRVTVSDGSITNGYAHLFDSSVVNKDKPDTPKPRTVADAGTELELYTARRLESGLTPQGKIGRIYQISADPFSSTQSNTKEKYVSLGKEGDKIKLKNKETGEIITLPSPNGGDATVEFNNAVTGISIL